MLHRFLGLIRYFVDKNARNIKKKKSLIFERLSAVLTRLELATSCVTGRHSNQTELQHLLFLFFVTICVIDYECKDTTFFHICKLFFKKNSLFLKLFFILLIIKKIKFKKIISHKKLLFL